jgi:hypothetical protein
VRARGGPLRPAGRRWPAALVRPAVAALLGGLLLAGTASSALAPPARAATATVSARVDLDAFSSTVMTPETGLTVQGRITNTGTATMTKLWVELYSRWSPLLTRSDLQRWAAGDAGLTGSANLRRQDPVTLAKPLAPGASTPFTIRITAPDLQLTSTSQFGSRGLYVDALAETLTAPFQRAGVVYTFMVWNPGRTGVQPTRLTVLAPVTSTLPQSDASAPQPELLSSMADTGRLGRLLSTVRDGNLSWAVDPALLAAAKRAQPAATTTGPSGSPTSSGSATDSSDGPTTTGAPSTGAGGTAGTSTAGTSRTGTSTAGSQSGSSGETAGATGSPSVSPSGTGSTSPSAQLATTAEAWLSAATALSAGDRPFALPFGDPDLAAIAHADAGRLLALARSQSDSTTRQVLGYALRSDVAWPADGRADVETARLLSSSWQGIVLAGSSLPPAQQQSSTPTGRGTVTQGGSPLPAALYDETLSTLIGQLGSPQTATALQRLVAELATLSAERPDVSRQVLAVAPRGWDPDPATAGPAFSVLKQVPWVHLQSLDTLLSQPPSQVRRSGLQYPRRARAAELPADHLRIVAGTEHSLEQFQPALSHPELVVPQLQRYAVSLAGLAWRGHTPELAAARAPLTSGVAKLYNGVVVVAASSLTMLSHSGRFNLTVQNRLDQQVQVQLVLRPKSGRLLVGKHDAFTVPANGHRTVPVSLRAVANGDVVVDAAVWTSPPGDQPISQPQQIVVRVHSNWENLGLSVAGIVLGLLVLLGLFRGIRRGRTPMPPESAPDADEEVVRRESGRRWAFGGQDRSADAGPGSNVPGTRSDGPGPGTPAGSSGGGSHDGGSDDGWPSDGRSPGPEDWFTPRVPPGAPGTGWDPNPSRDPNLSRDPDPSQGHGAPTAPRPGPDGRPTGADGPAGRRPARRLP